MHSVQFSTSASQPLVRRLTAFLVDGLAAGKGGVAFLTSEHRAALVHHPMIASALEDGRLVFAHARTTLLACQRGDEPDRDAFEAVVANAVRRMLTNPKIKGVVAYGDMAGMLWGEGRREAAQTLESYWTELMTEHDFDLFCSYPIDVLDPRFRSDAVDHVLRGHTHVIATTATDAIYERLIRHAMKEILGSQADELLEVSGLQAGRGWPGLPAAEARILWLRDMLPDEAERILERVRQLSTQFII